MAGDAAALDRLRRKVAEAKARWEASPTAHAAKVYANLSLRLMRETSRLSKSQPRGADGGR